MRLVDADVLEGLIDLALVDTIDEEHRYTKTAQDIVSGARLAKDAIKLAPTIEPSGDKGGDAQMNEIKNPYYMQPSPNNGADDLISRGLAMERIANDNVVGGMERINEYNNSTEFNDYLDGISDAITTIFCDVPSADITETETCQKCQEATERVLNRQGEEIKRLKASAEAVQGEWIKTVGGNGWNEWYVFKCQLCGATIEDKHYHSWKYNFCPNCGAEMKGGDDE